MKTFKIKYERVSNPSPVVDGFCLYVDGIKVHVGYFGSIERLREFWYELLVKEGYWSQRHDLAGIVDDYFIGQLKAFPLPPFYVLEWSRDCDMYESTHVTKVNSYIDLLKDYKRFYNGAEWAEGPRSWQLIPPTQQGTWSRDRAMEAYENGNGHSLFV